MPIAIGPQESTLIWDTNYMSWLPYLPIKDPITSLKCVVEHNQIIYYVTGTSGSNNTLSSLDLRDFSFEDLGFIANNNFLKKCSGLEIDGHFGIMSTYGEWFNLTDGSLLNLAPPPYPPGQNYSPPSNLFQFQGLPTIFGLESCSDGNCGPKEVWQYQSTENVWLKLGEMIIDREFHSIVEIPNTFCERLNNK